MKLLDRFDLAEKIAEEVRTCLVTSEMNQVGNHFDVTDTVWINVRNPSFEVVSKLKEMEIQ
jgi:hypothetical protein